MVDLKSLEKRVKENIRNIPDFPKKGIQFKDLMPLLKKPFLMNEIMLSFREHFSKNVDGIAGAEARGFIFGSILAYEMGVPFIALRKKGKLPFKTLREEFELEYGKDVFEMHIDALNKGDNILIFDDVIATGGTAQAAANLIKKAGGNIRGFAFIVELDYLKGREKIEPLADDIFSIVHYER